MESFVVRYRNLLVLLALLAAQLIGLAVQVHHAGTGENTLDRGDGAGVRLLRVWTIASVTPFERLLEGSTSGVGGLWRSYIDLRKSHEQNLELQKTLDRMRLEQASLLEDARQGERLQAQLGFQEQYIYQTTLAQVMGGSGTDHSRVFYINKGSSEGIARDMAVIVPEGIVGKVREVFSHSAQVLVMNDQASGAGVILETTRIRGILRGNAIGQPQIVGMLADQRIKAGEKVLTAGGDQIFPRGLPVGVIKKVMQDPERDAFILVLIEPYAHLNRLDEVMVITAMQPRFSADQLHDMATSEALKGPEAAAIRDRAIEAQKKAASLRAERLPGLTDPNAPPPDPTKPPVSETVIPPPPKAIHPDRYTPIGTAASDTEATGDVAPATQKPAAQQSPGTQQTGHPQPSATTPKSKGGN